MLDLRCCRAFSSCGARTSCCSGFSVEHRLWVLGLRQSWCTGLAVPWNVGSSQTRGRTSVPCIARQILNHWTTREASHISKLYISSFISIWHEFEQTQGDSEGQGSLACCSPWGQSLHHVQLCDPWSVAPRLLCPQDSPVKNTGVHNHSLLQGILPTQGENPDLLRCMQILYHLSHQGSPMLDISYSLFATVFEILCVLYSLSLPSHSSYLILLIELYHSFGQISSKYLHYYHYYCCLATKCPILCDPTDCSTPGFPILHCLPEFA